LERTNELESPTSASERASTSSTPRKETASKQTASENFRNWETKARRRELQQNNPQPEELQRDYRNWETKLRKGDLDPLLQKSKQTWLLDKVAKVPEELQMGTARTFWEVKATESNGTEKRCLSMPVRERPSSTPPSLRPSLRAGFESCARSNEDILQDVFSAYFVNVDEDTLRDDTSGRTLMLQDLRNRWSLADVLGVFDELGAEHVEYVFLPLSVWETKSKARDPLKKSQCRNKAYCFVHFSDVAASQAFVDRLNRYELPKGETPEGTVVREKKVHASFSSTQGIVPNLLRLVDIHSRRWHPRAGELALRLGEGLVPVSIAGLRQHLVGVLKEDPKEAPGCLQKHCTFSLFFKPSTFAPPSRAPLSAEAA
jgi:RNA recognition motif-containing protein